MRFLASKIIRRFKTNTLIINKLKTNYVTMQKMILIKHFKLTMQWRWDNWSVVLWI